MTDTQRSWRYFIWVGFVVFCLGAALGILKLPDIKFNIEIEQFFPEKDEDLEYFIEFKENFEADDNFLLIAVDRDSSIFDMEFMKVIKAFSIDARRLPHIQRVQSLPLLRSVRSTPLGLVPRPLLSMKDEQTFQRDAEAMRQDPLYHGTLVSHDFQSTVVFLKTKDDLKYEESQELIAGMDSLLGEYDLGGELHFLGRSYFQEEMAAFEMREIITSGILSLILVIGILIVLFRHWISVVLSVSIIAVSGYMLVLVMILIGAEFSALSAMFPVIIVIVGTSDVVHLFTKFFDEVQAGNSRKVAIQKTLRQIGIATLMTSVTTAIGFASLAVSNIYAVRDFGLYSAMGVLMAYIISIWMSYLFLPLIPRDICMKMGQTGVKIKRPLRRIYDWGLQFPRAVWLGFLLFMVVCGLGIWQISTDYKLVDTLPRGTQISEDFQYFEDNFGGYRPVEFAIELADNQDIWSPAVLRELNRLEDRLALEPTLTRPVSLVSYVKIAHRIQKGGSDLVFPDTDKKLQESIEWAQKMPPFFAETLVSKDKRKLRMSANMIDVGADSIKRIGQGIDRWIDQEIDKSILSIRRTGSSVLLDKNMEYLSRQLLYGLGLALGMVSIIMLILFKDWRMLLISLVPNLFPLAFAAALLGFLGIPIEAGVSIVFSIVFGIAVDDSIHFLSKFKMESSSGKSVEEALQVCFEETGKAIFITSVILFFGFLVLLFSKYPPSNTIGILISITLISALLCDLFLIPLLLRAMGYKIKKSSKQSRIE